MRQAHQWRMPVAQRQRIALADDFGHGSFWAGQRLAEQPQQRRLAFQHNAGATPEGQRRIADELDGGTQPLLGVNEQGGAVETLAGPRRAAEVAARGGKALDPPAPFVFGEPLIQPAEQQQQHRPVAVRRRVVGIRGDGLIAGGERFVEAPLLLQHQAEVGKRIGIARPAGDGLPQRRLGLRQPVLGAQGAAEVAQRLGVVRPHPQSLPIGRFRFRRCARRQPQVSLRVQRLGIRRIEGQGAANGGSRRIAPTESRQHAGVRHMKRGDPAVGGDGSSGQRQRLLVVAESMFEETEKVQRVRLPRPLCQHCR